MGIQKYRKQEIPRDRSDQQKLVDRAKCATLYRKYRDREWILDDESYFTKTHPTINGNETSCLDRYVTPWDFRAIHHGKWERS